LDDLAGSNAMHNGRVQLDNPFGAHRRVVRWRPAP
jgi:hypothetical protein